MELYTNLYKISLFMKMHLPSSFILRYVRSEMNVHAFMNELDQKDYWLPKKILKKIVKIYVQSQWRVVVLWYHIFCSIQRGRQTQLCIITSLEWIIQICSNLTVGFVILLSSYPIHIVVWGNFPFKVKVYCSIGGFEWISIDLCSMSTPDQTSENNLKPP